MRREYSERDRKWGDASLGADGRNLPVQVLHFGPARDLSGTSRGDSRRFLPDLQRLLKVTEQSLHSTILRHIQEAEVGNAIDICGLCRDLAELLDQHYGNNRSRFASEARRLIRRVVVDVPTSPKTSAPPPIRLYSNDVEPVPVSTYLFMAILMAQAQGSEDVPLGYDEKYGVRGTDGIPTTALHFAPTMENAVHEFEKTLWDSMHEGRSEPYKPSCDCSISACRQHRAIGDQRDKCNQDCSRYRLYAELDGREREGHRPFVGVPSSNWNDWSQVAANMPSVSFLRFGGEGLVTGPVSEDELVRALKAFFKKADKH